MRYFRRVAFMFLLMEAAWFSLFAQVLPQDLSTVISAPSNQADALATKDACALLQEKSTQLASKWNYSAAAAALQEALPVCQNRKDILLNLAEAQMLSQQFDLALANLHLLLTEDPNNIRDLITQGEIYYLLNKDSDAKFSLLQAIYIAPEDAIPHYWLGRIYYEDSRLQDAIVEFEKALKLNSDDYKSYDGLALCYENVGDIRLTVQTYMKGIAVVYKDHPNYDVIYADFSEFLLRYGENEKAFNLAAEAAKRNPHQSRNFFLAGKAAEADQKYDVSVRWLTKAVDIDPTYPDPHYLLARIFRRTGDVKSATNESAIFQALSAKTPNVRR